LASWGVVSFQEDQPIRSPVLPELGLLVFQLWADIGFAADDVDLP
jgi:hypothetical protein